MRIWVIPAGGIPPRMHEFDRQSVDIGRAPSNDIVLDRATVSRHHARVTVEGESLVVRDLGSSCGTFVRGEQVSAPVVVTESECIDIGDFMVYAAPAGPARDAARSLPEVEKRFLQLIQEDPANDEIRRRYGEWLLEHGEFRGELIALQCPESVNAATSGLASDLASDPMNHPTSGRDARAARCRTLLAEYGPRWLAPAFGSREIEFIVEGDRARVALPAHPAVSAGSQPRLERGFLAHPLCVTPPRWSRFGDGLLRLSPTVYEILGRVSTTRFTTVHAARAHGAERPGSKVCLERATFLFQASGGIGTEALETASRQRLLELERAQAVPAHPNLVRYLGPAYWASEAGGGDIALVLEWLDGCTLQTLLERVFEMGDRLHPAIAVEVARQLCSGCHALGVVNRLVIDPDEVVVTRDGHVKLFGFNVAEQIQPRREPGWRLQSSIGCLVFQLVTGEAPDERDMAGLCGDGREARAWMESRMPAEIVEIARCAMDDQADGYATTLELQRALDDLCARSGWPSGPEWLARELAPVLVRGSIVVGQ